MNFNINRTAVTGFGVAAAVVWFGVLHHAARPAMFLDPHAIILVLGGTAAAALIAFPVKQLFSILDMLFLATLFPKKKNYLDVATDIMKVADGAYAGKGILANVESHGFLREALKLASNSRMSPAELERVLRKRASFYKRRYQMDYKVLNALAKFPPAFGLLGASTGMIEMMSNLGKGGTESIGSAMAVALVATFWGIALANLVFLPLADHANKIAADDQGIRDLIIEGTLCIARRDSFDVLFESLISFLPLDIRPELRPIVSQRTSQQTNSVKKVG
jgi:chemotaxis protein MotA